MPVMGTASPTSEPARIPSAMTVTAVTTKMVCNSVDIIDDITRLTTSPWSVMIFN